MAAGTGPQSWNPEEQLGFVSVTRTVPVSTRGVGVPIADVFDLALSVGPPVAAVHR